MTKIIKTHIDNIQPGDAIIRNGQEKTVSVNNIKQDKFIGKTVFGDSYMLGIKMVDKVVYPNWSV